MGEEFPFWKLTGVGWYAKPRRSHQRHGSKIDMSQCYISWDRTGKANSINEVKDF
jgi:hypothetical protein